MLKPRRRVAVGITALAAAVSTMALAVPAEALVAPTWPATTYVPTGCSGYLAGGPLGSWTYTFTDTSEPTITKLTIGAASGVNVVPVAGTSLSVTAQVSAPCTGARFVWVYPRLNGGSLPAAGQMAPNSTDAFHGSWSINLADAMTGLAGVTKPDSAGVYTIPLAFASRRYDQVVLDKDLNFVSKIDTVIPGTAPSVPLPNVQQKFYVLRATTLSNAVSAAKVAKGKTVKATAVFKYATNAGFVAYASAKVKVQTKIGTGAWVTNATLTTSAAGIATYSFAVSKATSVRFVAASALSGKFTNGATSAIKTVKVA
jgi:hypothetical protein